MLETFDLNDSSPKNGGRSLSSHAMEEILPTLNPTAADDHSFDTLTLNPFKDDEQERRPKKFLNPFEEDERNDAPDQSRSHRAASLHRPKFPEKVDNAEVYIVKKGDSPWSIARDVLKARTGRTPSANEIVHTMHDIAESLGENDAASILLRPGDKLWIPLSKSASEKVAATTTAIEAQKDDGSKTQSQSTEKPQNSTDVEDKKDIANPAKAEKDAAVVQQQSTDKPLGSAVVEEKKNGSESVDSSESQQCTAETTVQVQQDSTNDGTSGKAVKFSRENGAYSPVRPPGIAEMSPGESADSDKDTGIDFRTSVGTRPEGENTTTYRYQGDLEDSGYLPWNWGDTGFTGEERLGPNGVIMGTKVSYESPISVKFKSLDGTSIDLENVTSVETTRRADGNYVSVVKTSGESQYTFITNPGGEVRNFW